VSEKPDENGRGNRLDDQGLNRVLGQWLDEFPWTHWGTFTFRVGCPSGGCSRHSPGECVKGWGETGPSPERAFKHIGGFLDTADGTPGYFYCVETGRLGRVHGHGLLRFDQFRLCGTPCDPGELTFRSWKDRYGRCQLRAYDPKLGAAYYCGKYVTKEALLWDVGRLTLESC